MRVDAIKRVRHPNESEARQLLQAIEVRIEERNGSVEVRTDYPRRNWSGGVDYTVAVPRDANVILRSVSGIRVSNLNGDLRAETASGDITASAIRRLRQAKTFSGDLEITDSDGEDVVGSTISGTIVARGLKARSVDLQSVSGDVRMTDLESDRTLCGRCREPWTSRTPGDDRPLRVPVALRRCQSCAGRASGFSIEASTFNGDLRSDYPLTLQGNPQQLHPPQYPRHPRLLRRRWCGAHGAVIQRQYHDRQAVGWSADRSDRVTLGSCVDQLNYSALFRCSQVFSQRRRPHSHCYRNVDAASQSRSRRRCRRPRHRYLFP